jgi:hypothetical protein
MTTLDPKPGQVPAVEQEYAAVIDDARALFLAKLEDYGPSWRMFRFPSVVDQIFIKAKRIRRLELLNGRGKIPDSIEQEYTGIVNYCVVALDMLLHEDLSVPGDIESIPARWSSRSIAARSYDAIVDRALSVLKEKNHDYGEAWRDMEITSLTDEILGRVARIKHMLRRSDGPKVSENVDAQVVDALNYAVLALIKMNYENRQHTPGT